MEQEEQPKGEPTWADVQKKRVREVFDLFDKDKKNCVAQEEVGTIMRACGVYPTEKQWVKDMLDEIQGDEPTAFVTYERLEAKILELLTSHACDPDTDDTLLQAFRLLDTENQGYITVNKMRELLTTRGTTPFRDKEIDAFLSVAKDLETGHIYYEDYIRILTAELETGNN